MAKWQYAQERLRELWPEGYCEKEVAEREGGKHKDLSFPWIMGFKIFLLQWGMLFG
jgi:hypothetical protein